MLLVGASYFYRAHVGPLSGTDATPPPCRAPGCSYTPVAALSAVLRVLQGCRRYTPTPNHPGPPYRVSRVVSISETLSPSRGVAAIRAGGALHFDINVGRACQLGSISSTLYFTVSPSIWAAANGGVTNGGLRGVWPPFLEIGRNRPKSPFFCLFRPFPEGAKSTWEIQKTEEKGLFPQISSDFLKPPSLKPPFAARQSIPDLFSRRFRGGVCPETALLQALSCAFCSTEQSMFRGGEKAEKAPRKGEQEGWPLKGQKGQKDARK